jgi:hypothetical protein
MQMMFLILLWALKLQATGSFEAEPTNRVVLSITIEECGSLTVTGSQPPDESESLRFEWATPAKRMEVNTTLRPANMGRYRLETVEWKRLTPDRAAVLVQLSSGEIGTRTSSREVTCVVFFVNADGTAQQRFIQSSGEIVVDRTGTENPIHGYSLSWKTPGKSLEIRDGETGKSVKVLDDVTK